MNAKLENVFASFIIVFSTGSILISGCSKGRETGAPRSDTASHEESELAKLSSTIRNIYPHNDDFLKPENHGRAAHSQSRACAVCHGNENDGKLEVSATAAPSCTSCHSAYGLEGHSADFKNTAQHGTAFLNDRKLCQSCHGADYKGGTSGTSCNQCHNFPHTGAWAVPANHGSGSMAERQPAPGSTPLPAAYIKCENCHIEKLPDDKEPFSARHPQDSVLCTNCHKSFPHAKGFDTHHSAIAAKPEGKCQNCHDDYKRLMNPRDYTEGCLDCHEGSLPDKEWKGLAAGADKSQGSK